MRNPLTASLVAMAVHTAASVAFGWPYPSPALLLAGFLAIGWSVARPARPPRGTAGIVGLALLAPPLLPPPFVAAVVAPAVLALPFRDEPLANATLALPALTVLLLAMTL